MDPITLVMFALIAVLIFFMFRNGKKRREAMEQMQNGLRPGAEVMLQSGIFGTVESVEAEENRVTILSGTSTLVVHRNAISQIVTPAETVVEEEIIELAPDDDPEFGERVAKSPASDTDQAEQQATDDEKDSDAPKS
ncbi:MAG: preprotein translocase subunit YajC [Leucobacter sp.]